jgi:hypothetical protein
MHQCLHITSSTCVYHCWRAAVGCAALCLLAAFYVLPMLSQQAFNEIWKTRLLLQISCFALAVRTCARATC